MEDYSQGGLTLEQQLAIAYGAPATGSGNFDDNEIANLAMAELIDGIDTKTGAPAGIRALVGASQSPEDKLTTLKKEYPDALPIEVLDPQYGAAKFGAGNFVFTDPETGTLTLFDEETRLFGMPVPGGLGDFADVGPEIAETVGSIVGGSLAAIPAAAAGALTLPVVGSVPAATVAYSVGEGIGSAAAREAYIGILDYFGETEDSRIGAERMVDFSNTALINAFSGPIVSSVFKGLKWVAGSPVRYANNALDTPAREALERMTRTGVTNPTLGQATGSPLFNMMEKWFSVAPTSTKRMVEVAEQTLKELGDSARNLATKYGGVRTKAEAAGAMYAAGKLAKKRYRAERDAMYQEVQDVVGETPSPAKNIIEWYEANLATSREAVSGPAMAPAMDYASRMLKEASEGTLTFAKIKGFRSSITDMLSKPEIVAALQRDGGAGFDIKTSIEALSGMMKKDMDELVESAASKQMDLFDPTVGAKQASDLVKKYDAAQAFVAKNMADDGDITFLNNFLKRGKEDAVDALTYAFSGVSDSAARLKKLKSLYTPEEFDVVSGYLLGKMGLPGAAGINPVELGDAIKTGDEYIRNQGFSVATFLNNFQGKSGLSKEAQDVLFRGTRYADLQPALDDLIFTMNRINSTAAQMANPSGSGKLLYGAGTLGVIASEFGGVLSGKGFEMGLGGLITPAVGAAAFTHPAFVRWLSKGLEIAAYNPKSFPQHIRRLLVISQENPDIAEEIQAILQGLQGETLEPIDWQKSTTNGNTPKVPEDNEAAFRQVVPKSTADKLLPDREELMARLDSMEVPQVGIASESVFEPLPQTGGSSAPGSSALSPAVLPNDADRELALRMQANRGGIAALS